MEIVTACLARDPDERWQSLADVGRLLQRLGRPAAGAAAVPAAPSQPAGLLSPAVAWGAAALLAVALGAALAVAFRSRPPEHAYAFRVEPPEGTYFHSAPRVSPDGRFVATAGWDGIVRLWHWRAEDLIAEARTRLTRELTAAERERHLPETVT